MNAMQMHACDQPLANPVFDIYHLDTLLAISLTLTHYIQIETKTITTNSVRISRLSLRTKQRNF